MQELKVANIFLPKMGAQNSFILPDDGSYLVFEVPEPEVPVYVSVKIPFKLPPLEIRVTTMSVDEFSQIGLKTLMMQSAFKSKSSFMPAAII